MMRLSAADISHALSRLPPGGPVVLTHSSLSSCGYIPGGPRTVMDVLCAWAGERLLAMPTHTYCYPEESGVTPVFDPDSTPSVVGAVTDYFWRQPGVARSIHPTHSLAALGPGSETLCAGHEECGTPCGPGTPYEKLVESDASVLMFGASLNSYTLFHTAEDAGGAPYLYEAEPYELSWRAKDGHINNLRMLRQDMTFPRRFAAMDEWLESRGLLVRQPLGWGELLWIPSAHRAHDSVVREIKTDPYFLADQAP